MTAPGAETSSAPRYGAVGVDVDANDRLIPRYRELAELARRPEQVGAVGAFSGLFDLSGWERPTLVASTDGVGTKVLLASLVGRLDGVGRDLVNHSINDILTAGAEPLFFLDYLAGNGLTEDEKVAIVCGVAEACRDSGLALLGGETADMPDVYRAGEFDLAGTIVGVVDRERAITGESITPGDVLIGLPSNGLHTNGYSLARDALGLRGGDAGRRDADSRDADEARRATLLAHEVQLGETLADALLRPHIAYWSALRPVLGLVKGLAHITGGGIAGNLERVLPAELGATLDRAIWSEPPIFKLIQRRGEIESAEMFRVFNMGVGMIVVAAAADSAALCAALDGAERIGEVTAWQAGARVHIDGL